MRSLIKLIHSGETRPTTHEVRVAVDRRKKMYEQLKERSDSPSNRKFYDLLIEELDDIKNQTNEYDNMQSTLEGMRKNKN
jgi:hypothetical protein